METTQETPSTADDARNGWPAVVADPGPAGVDGDAPPQALWLEPTCSLSAAQLREVQGITGMHQQSLVEVKKRFADGRPHLLVEEHPNYVREMAQRLSGQSIAYRIL